MRTVERFFDPAMWAWCWLALHLLGFVPSWRGPRAYRLWLWLLPFAGFYAYHEPGETPWRWSERVR